MTGRNSLLRKFLILTVIIVSGSLFAQSNDFIGRSYFRYQIKDSVSADSAIYSGVIKDSIRFIPDLYKKGTVYRGIKIGADSGTGIISGLNLEIKGNITDSVEVAAYISDDQLAVSEEGSTEALSDIERIYIQFRHPNFLSRMGDFKTEYSDGEFGELKKDLSGAFLRLNDHNNSIDGFISAQSSRFETFRTNGAEAVSGPYLIKTSSGLKNEIVPNSETIYLNGIRLKSGEDYFLDYKSSELYFKPKIQIRKSDVIIIDYQFLFSDYKRTAYGFNSENRLFGNMIKTTMNYYSESDDRTKPVSFDMDDDTEDLMENISDSYIFVSGAELSDGGSYDLMPDSVHYSYSGTGNGDYSVKFTFFEAGGEYDISYDSLGTAYFIYDPADGGNYLPLIKINTPQGYSRFHSSANYTGRNIVAETEIAASSSNDNLFYTDKKEFKGLGDRERLMLKTDEKKYGIFELDLSRKSYNGDLVLPSRLNDVYSEGEIDPSGIEGTEGTSDYKAEIRHRFGKYTLNSFGYKYLETGGSSIGRTGSFGTEGYFGNYSYTGMISLSELNRDSIKTEKSFYGLNGSYRTERINLRPYYKNVTERNISKPLISGTDEKKFGNEFGFIFTQESNISLKTELDLYDQIEHKDRREYLRRFSNTAELKNRIGSQLNSEALWTKVVNDYISNDSTDTEYDHLSFKVNYNKSDEYRVYAEYETERTQYAPKIRSYYKVEDGTGSFALVDGDYYPDDFGNYDYYTVLSDNLQNLTGVKFDLKTFFDFEDRHENDNILYWLSRIDIEQDLTLKEKTTDPDISSIMFLNLAEFQTDSTVNGTIESRTGLYFLRNEDNSCDYSYNYRKNLFREYRNYTDNSLFREQAASFRNRSGDFTHKIKGRVSSLERYGISNTLTDDLSKKYISYNFRHNLTDGINYSVEFEYGKEKESVREAESDSYRVSAVVSAAFNVKGIIRLGSDGVRVISGSSIPYSMNSGYGRGLSYKWNISSDYSFNKSISGNLNYSGRYLSSDPKPFHELKAEIRMNL